MADDAPVAPPATPPAPEAPWYAPLPEDIRGYVEHNGLVGKTPLEAFQEAAKAHKAAQAHIGVPADQLIRLPQDNNPDAWKPIWQRLGAPGTPDGYDLSSVKMANGEPLDADFVNFARNTAAQLNMPKDTAVKWTAELTRYVEAQNAQESQQVQAKVEASKTALKTNWGQNFDANLGVAKTAARAFGIKETTLNALENSGSYDEVMEFLRQVGSRMGEDGFVSGTPNPAQEAKTVDGAKAALEQLFNDPDWRTKFLAGGTKEKQDYDRLFAQANPQLIAAANA